MDKPNIDIESNTDYLISSNGINFNNEDNGITVSSYQSWELDISKVKTLDDVINVLEAINIQWFGVKLPEKLEPYFKKVDE